eukprot:TRINITY_DN61340_c0_g1_i1.p1 TRINITY_DN61340_c0_g1~~TRINITY_DN61340_c0_g1_i1.p1  ORF type:complete len:346 (-),score=3.03 TRINITY_DN61340_c0_g1_i1:107-1144(-)
MDTPVAEHHKGKVKDFYYVNHMEPHAERRSEILAKYPQIKDLFGPCPMLKYKLVAAVLVQLTLAYFVRDLSWWWVVPIAWCVGGTFNNMLSLGTHELCHNLAFDVAWKNDALGFICNVAMGFPSTMTFRKYHLEHHQFQGVEHLDADIPVRAEAEMILNNRLTKFLFVCTQPAFYALRPLFMIPKPIWAREVLNLVWTLTTNGLIFYFWGPKSLFYVVGGTLMGLSLHPCAGHFLAEHYVWDPYKETNSYYGPLNALSLNVGYHVEHHDFPRIPGSRLPKLHQIASEYYPVNPKYQSWTAVLWNFVQDENMSSYNRVVRTMQTHRDGVRRLREKKTRMLQKNKNV